MSSLLARRLCLFFPFSLTLLSPLLRLSVSFSSSTQPLEQEEKEIPFLVNYLISSFGFSPDRARRYSIDRGLTAVKSSDRPESVVRFLKEMGLSDTQINAVVSFYPPLLASNVEKTLKPRVHELMDKGFSGELLVQFIRYNPKALLTEHSLSRLLFWRDFVGNCDRTLLKIIPRNSMLMTYDVDKHVVPRINLLNEYGFSNRDIVSLLGHERTYMSCNLNSLRQTIELIEELGIPKEAGMFLSAVKAVGAYNRDTLERKVEFFKMRYGWSQEELCVAFRKCPSVLKYAEEKVKSKMHFLISKVGFEARKIAFQSWLLICSVERVLIPRYTVLSALKAKGMKKNISLLTACKMTETSFRESCVVPFEKFVPGLGEAYAAAYGGKAEVLSDLMIRMRNSASDRYACLVAESVNESTTALQELAGVVDVTVQRDEDVLVHLNGAEEYLYISGITVLKKFRKKVGTVLLKGCDALSHQWRYNYLALRAYEDDISARRLYSSARYKVMARDPLWWTMLGMRHHVLMIKQSNFQDLQSCLPTWLKCSTFRVYIGSLDV